MSRAAAPRRLESWSSQVCSGLDQLSRSRLAWLQLGFPVTRKSLGGLSPGAEGARLKGRGRPDPGSRRRRPRPLISPPPRAFPGRRRVTGGGGWPAPEPREGRRQTQSLPLPSAPLLLFLLLLLPLRPGGETQPRASPRATARPRLRDLRGGPVRGKGRWPRRPHPQCPHPAPEEAPGRLRGAVLGSRHGVLLLALSSLPEGTWGERESECPRGVVGSVGEEVPGSGTPGPG